MASESLMTSSKQLAANKANAKKSTGPVTAKGKVRSSLNARTHGLTAEQIIIPGESPDDYEVLCKELHRQWSPSGPTEIVLVQRLSILLWRLRRAPVVEAAIFEALMTQGTGSDLQRQLTLSHISQIYEKKMVDRANKRVPVVQADVSPSPTPNEKSAQPDPKCSRSDMGRALIRDA